MTDDLAAPLRIAVLGCGNIGSTFALHLARAGHDVTAIARPGSARLEQLRRDNAIVGVKGERVAVRVADRLDATVPYALVIVTLLAHQVDAVLPTLQASAATCVQFMFNTFDAEGLRKAIGNERCAFGMPFVQAKLNGEGRLTASVGAAGQKTLLDRQRWVDLFVAVGLPAALERDMPLWLRCHVPLCVAFESVSVAAVRHGTGASWREALVLARGIHASFRLIEALGGSIYPTSKKRIDRLPDPIIAGLLWFLSRVPSFRDLLATGEVECAALVDAMLAAAPLAGTSAQTSALAAMKPL